MQKKCTLYGFVLRVSYYSEQDFDHLQVNLDYFH